MPRSLRDSGVQAISLISKITIPEDSQGPCRAYITGADVQDKKGKSMWYAYFMCDGKTKQMIDTPPLTWREASRLVTALNRRSGLLVEQQQPEAVSA